MSLIKKNSKKVPNSCKVTFRLPKEALNGAKSVNLVGDFNNWSKEDTPMKPSKSGDYKALLTLEKGKSYQFRYLLDGETWENDWAADEYAPSPFQGVENSVVEL